ncbi:hypothetical protein C9I57_06935 [Trinickia symbiotica]|uniref:Peptide-binding protein n=1 Tax=Trinickia symbiotica TaxID=863227 RepID=A0A2T3XXZ9_9BURK|nr:hypothetical protein [Trinickia symbiotica]PTB21388.1 hypothetical protein C9I57_06935 [Trinickia symbiotica]
MADAAFQTIGRWMTAAICAAAMSLAQAAPHMPAHAGAVSFRQPANFGFGGFSTHPAFIRQPGADYLQIARSTYPETGRSPRSRAAASSRHERLLPPAAAGGIPYRPVSENARNVPRPPDNSAYVRAGSIRDAVTRYNEERESGRVAPRPPSPGTRMPDPWLYRN